MFVKSVSSKLKGFISTLLLMEEEILLFIHRWGDDHVCLMNHHLGRRKIRTEGGKAATSASFPIHIITVANRPYLGIKYSCEEISESWDKEWPRWVSDSWCLLTARKLKGKSKTLERTSNPLRLPPLRRRRIYFLLPLLSPFNPNPNLHLSPPPLIVQSHSVVN